MKTNVRHPRFFAQLAIIFLVIGCIAPAQSLVRNSVQNEVQNPTPIGTTTFIILANRRTQPRLWPILESTLRRDAAAISRTAPVTAGIDLVLAGPDTPGPSFPGRLEVEFLGRCDTPWDNISGNDNPANVAHPSTSSALGWVLEDSHKIAPIIYIDCAQINDVLGPQARTIPENLRLRIASEAISHVILHEWIHIATQSAAHSSHGIMEPGFTAVQLTTPIADAESPHSKSQAKSETGSGSGGGQLMGGFTLLIGNQR